MAGLLALVANLLTGSRLLGALAGQMAGLAAVVALGTVHAVACRLVRSGTQQGGASCLNLRDRWPTPPQE